MSVSNKTPLSSMSFLDDNETLNYDIKIGEYNNTFDAYMYTEMGAHNYSNNDNFYMDGISMKSFNFTNMEKKVENIGESAVFALSSGDPGHASKIVLKALDEKREWIVTSPDLNQAQKRLEDTILFCHQSLIDEGSEDNTTYEASLIVVVYYKQHVLYTVFGEGTIFYTRNNRAKMLKAYNQMLGGDAFMQINIGKMEFTKNDRMILCTNGATSVVSPETMMYSVASETEPERIVGKMFEHLVYSREDDRTCMAICAVPAGGIRTKTMIIAAVSLLVTIINAMILLLR